MQQRNTYAHIVKIKLGLLISYQHEALTNCSMR